MRRITDILIIALAVIAAVVATGLIMGWSMWAWIIIYWLALTVKNVLDYIRAKREERDEQKDCENFIRIMKGMGYNRDRAGRSDK